MAGDWIKMRGNLWDDPRIARLVDLTDSSEAAVVGACYWLWATADQHTEDGIMPGLSLRQIDRKTGVQGFGEALCAIGWLDDHPDGVRIIGFIEHNGASAKKRCQTAKRVANHAAANAKQTQEPENTNAESVSGALAREREEKEKSRVDISSSLRSEDSAAKTQRASSRPKREEVTLAKFLETCKAAGVKPVPDNHPIRAWCEDARIPGDMVQIAWVVFREKYLGDEKLKNKRYKDWASHFATSVKDRWYGLWFVGEDGAPQWTATGLQRKQVLDAKANREAA